MAKRKYLMKTGFALSFLAVFYVALGAHLLHPFCHDHPHPGHKHGARVSLHHQFTPFEPSEECTICLFLKFVQLLDEWPVTAMMPLPVETENATPHGPALPSKPFYQSFHSRGPPLI